MHFLSSVVVFFLLVLLLSLTTAATTVVTTTLQICRLRSDARQLPPLRDDDEDDF